jgi:hypothetical protein
MAVVVVVVDDICKMSVKNRSRKKLSKRSHAHLMSLSTSNGAHFSHLSLATHIRVI